MEFKKINSLDNKIREVEGDDVGNGGDVYQLSKEEIQELNQLYLNEDYETYYVEYAGNIRDSINKIDYAKIFFPGRFFAVVLVKEGMLEQLVRDVPELTNLIRFFPFTLSELTVSDFPHDPKVISKGSVDLDGSGVVVGIIGTGIDYLNKNFIREDGKSRVISIWDQSLNTGPIPYGFIHGTEFTSEEINRAIGEQALGRDPYAVVNHKDDGGHGTAIAGIIGGKSSDNPESLVSVAPNCDFVIVRLGEAKARTLELIGLENPRAKVYGSYNITSAIRYMADMQQKLKRPMVVYVPVGSNLGGHDGGTIPERYIDLFSQRRDIAFVGDSGNQGNAATHASGQLERIGDRKVIEINVDNDERNLDVSLYIVGSDRIKVGITAPTGEEIENISIPNKIGEVASANLGGSQISIQYFPERQGIPDARLDILIKNVKSGIWELNLTGEFITNGRYDAWLFQKELLAAGTKFINPDPYTTMMTPATAINSIVTASFNQQTGENLEQSGRGFTRDNRIKPSVTTSSVNALTTGLDNKLIVASGAAMAGAILTGTVALLFQWGIVQGNSKDMYPQRPRNYIVAGTIKQQDVSYPTPEVGFGQLNIEGVFQNLMKIQSRNSMEKTSVDEESTFCSGGICTVKPKEEPLVASESSGVSEGLYVNIPRDIYEKLIYRGIGNAR